MPTYEYQCKACSHEFEEFLPISHVGAVACPDCGSEETKRRISGGAGFVFKGSGFYHTDYKLKETKSSKEKAAEASGGEPKTTKGEKSSGGESKPDSKPQPTSNS